MREAPKQSIEAFAKKLFSELNEYFLLQDQAKILADVRLMIIHHKEQEIEKHMANTDEARNSLQAFIEIMEGPKQEYCGMSMPSTTISIDELRKNQ